LQGPESRRIVVPNQVIIKEDRGIFEIKEIINFFRFYI